MRFFPSSMACHGVTTKRLGRHLWTSLSEAKDVVNKKQHILGKLLFFNHSRFFHCFLIFLVDAVSFLKNHLCRTPLPPSIQKKVGSPPPGCKHHHQYYTKCLVGNPHFSWVFFWFSQFLIPVFGPTFYVKSPGPLRRGNILPPSGPSRQRELEHLVARSSGRTPTQPWNKGKVFSTLSIKFRKHQLGISESQKHV